MTGLSSACPDCWIIEQTFPSIVLYLILPLCVLYILTQLLKLKPILKSILLVAYFIPVSFIKLTVPIFKDRIAAWSTYNDNEIWDEAVLQATPTLVLLSLGFMLAIFYVNNKPKIKD